MYVRCINDEHCFCDDELTKGKVYKVLQTEVESYRPKIYKYLHIGDNGQYCYNLSSRFIKINEEEQLNEFLEQFGSNKQRMREFVESAKQHIESFDITKEQFIDIYSLIAK